MQTNLFSQCNSLEESKEAKAGRVEGKRNIKGSDVLIIRRLSNSMAKHVACSRFALFLAEHLASRKMQRRGPVSCAEKDFGYFVSTTSFKQFTTPKLII